MTFQSDSYFRGQADRCRRLARGVCDPLTVIRLNALAIEYDRQANDRQNILSQPEPAAPDRRDR